MSEATDRLWVWISVCSWDLWMCPSYLKTNCNSYLNTIWECIKLVQMFCSKPSVLGLVCYFLNLKTKLSELHFHRHKKWGIPHTQLYYQKCWCIWPPYFVKTVAGRAVQMDRSAEHRHFGSILTAIEHVDEVHFLCAQLTTPKFWQQINHYVPENVYYINIVLSGSVAYYSHSFCTAIKLSLLLLFRTGVTGMWNATAG